MAKASVPLPREHGAWAMVVGPAIVGLAVPPIETSQKGVSSASATASAGAAGSESAPAGASAALSTLAPAGIDAPASAQGLSLPVGGTLLLIALLTLFCLQYVVVRHATAKRKDPSLPRWAVAYGATGTLAGALLVFAGGHWELLAIGAIAVIYFGLHLLQVRRPGRREHRALGFELLTVAVLCLGAPAGAIVAGASATGTGTGAFWAYVLSFLFFAGSVFHVRAIVRRLQRKSVRPETIRRLELARESVVWHSAIALFVGALGLGVFGAGDPGASVRGAAATRTLWLSVAFVPAVTRALRTALRLRRSVWNLRTIGLVELGCTVAFVVGTVLLLHGRWLGRG